MFQESVPRGVPHTPPGPVPQLEGALQNTAVVTALRRANVIIKKGNQEQAKESRRNGRGTVAVFDRLVSFRLS